jgi:kumamolisin
MLAPAPPPAAALTATPSTQPSESAHTTTAGQPIGPDPGNGFVRLSGHVLELLSKATLVKKLPETHPRSLNREKSDSLLLTLVLKREDQPGFERYMEDVYNPHSQNYRRFLNPVQIAERFGPSRRSYARVLEYLRAQGFELIESSTNRMTLTVRGTRTIAEHAFGLHFADYEIAGNRFFANQEDPALPRTVASHVETVFGLSNLARPHAAIRQAFGILLDCVSDLFVDEETNGSQRQSDILQKCARKEGSINWWLNYANGYLTYADPSAGDWVTLDGTGQTIGLLEFDSFAISDVANYLALIGAPASQINNLSEVPVNGGTTAGSDQDEVLLDIDTVMTAATGAKVKVYDAPFTGQAADYVALFNAMINGGVTIISNSWSSCEDQVSLADAQSIDAILQTAAASGISVFNGAGDSGSSCLDGSANTVGVPADSPNATAVGGTSPVIGPGNTYGSETWWNGTNSTPVTGQGGFGVSKYFTKPAYQNALNSSAMRSVPDVVFAADPVTGVIICEASTGGCPTGLSYGGTSFSAPAWAAMAAILNESHGSNLGSFNSAVYPLANTNAFHGAASMGSDFFHVGLGSPNLNALALLLNGQTAGTPSAATSEVVNYAANGLASTAALSFTVPDDGASQGYVVVRLRDSATNTVAGKTVTLSASGGSSTVTPSSAVTTTNNGAAVFTVTDLNPETITFTATDATDGIQLSQTANVTFVVAPATGASISATPSTEPADGQTAATITVTLKDALNRPTPGKTIAISDGGAHAVITQTSGGASASGVTDANGQIVFAATDAVAEMVTFSAVDVTDGNLPVPGTAPVTYSGSTQTACGLSAPPVAAAGYSITPFITGFPAVVSFPFGGLNFGCEGVQRPAFPSSGGVLVTDELNGALYDLPLAGGVASSANLLAQLSTTLGNLVFGADGSLYASIATVATAGSAVGSGSIVQLDPVTGTVKSTIASGLTCPYGLAIDPLSGDLFFDDSCSGGGTDDPTVYRVIDPDNSNPARPTSVVPYATLPTTPNGGMAFAPNGTLYVVSGYGVFTAGNGIVQQVSGTNAASVTVTALTGINSELGVNIGATNADGSAQSLIVEPAGSPSASLTEVPIANPAAATLLASTVPPGLGAVGPDGCLYLGAYDTVYRIANSAGSCAFATTSTAPAITLAPVAVSPNPAQGASQTFTATVKNVTPSSGVPVLFSVSGANPQGGLAVTNASGNATFSYTGRLTGTDRVVASATVSGAQLTSNVTPLTWTTGKHVTFLTLNTSPQGGIAGQPVSVVASLADVSASPAAALAGQTISFSLGGSTCNAQTGANGSATCQLTPSQVGSSTLTASFGGSSAYVASMESAAFHVTAAISTNPPPSVTIGVAPTSVTVGTAAQLTWSSANATSCVASNAWSGPKATSGTLSVNPATPSTYTYVLTCTNTLGASASAQAVLVVKPAVKTTTVITWPTPAPITYGTALGNTQLDAKANVAGTFSYSPAAGTVLSAGVHTLSVTFTPASSAYTPAQASVQLSVQQATPYILWLPLPIFQGTPLGPFQLDAIAFEPGKFCRLLPGKFVYTPAAGKVLPAGKQMLSATFTPDDANFKTVTVHATLEVWPSRPW